MKKSWIIRILCVSLVAVLLAAGLAACGGSKDAVSGTWKQTDEVNGDWTWEFSGGKCKLVGDTTGFESAGTYVLDEDAGTITVTLDGWTAEKVYNYTLTDTTLDLEETYSSYHLVKQ